MKRREAIGFDITPLIDIVFILFTFFLVATTMKKDKRELNITLPKTNSYYVMKEKKNIEIELSSTKILFNKKEFSILGLNKELTRINKDKIIELYIGENVNYKRISKLLDLLMKNNLNNISLVTIKKVKK